MVNDILQTIVDYIELPNTDYAILINGQWGCGKTYFWRNLIKSELKKQVAPQKTPLYASFYGCENTKDVDSQLFLSSYPKIMNKYIKKFATTGGDVLKGLFKKTTSVEAPSINLRWLIRTKNTVICFDDLERSDMPFKVILGYINAFVEHEGAKVVILCSENDIAKSDIELYKKMKEKVVGCSLNYKPDYKVVLSTLMDEYKEQKEFHAFLVENTELILHLFRSSQTDNLRSLRRAITSLNLIFKVINEKGIDHNKLSKQLIYAVMPTAFELYGRAADPEKLKSIHAMDNMSLVGISMRSRRSGEDTKKTYEENFNDCYFNQFGFIEMKNAVGCPPICDYMITGYLDKELLFEWAAKLTKEPDEKEKCINHLIYNAREMEDDEFEETASQVLGYIESGDIIEINRYVRLYPHFEWYVDNGLINLNIDQLIEKFQSGLTKTNKSGTLQPCEHLSREINHILNKPKFNETNQFRDFVLDMNKKMFEQQRSCRIDELLSNFQDDPMKFINALAYDEESSFLLIPFFNQLDIEGTVRKILSMSNDLKTRFSSALNKRYLKYQPQSEYLEELPALKQIRDSIRSQCQEPAEDSVKPMSLFATQNIVDILDKIILTLEDLRKK